ncbi:MAG: hypothetical protein GY909_09250 [Oligoflexia bacterium]|nr:hypothetical protein [Oligoflexia bacterium]
MKRVILSFFLIIIPLAASENYQCDYDFTDLNVNQTRKSGVNRYTPIQDKKKKRFASYMYKLISDYEKNTMEYLELTDAEMKASKTKELERDYHIINSCFSNYRKKFPNDNELVKSLIKSIKSLKSFSK